MDQKVIREGGREIVTGIEAGYVIAFNLERKTILIFKNEKMHPLYFNLSVTDNQLRIDFLHSREDFDKFALVLADINNLRLYPIECGGKPAWIFREKSTEPKTEETR